MTALTSKPKHNPAPNHYRPIESKRELHNEIKRLRDRGQPGVAALLRRLDNSHAGCWPDAGDAFTD